GELDAVGVDPLTEYRQAGGELRWLDVDNQTGPEAIAEPILERLQVRRRTIGGEHDLAPTVLERVEGMEELLLALGLPLEELDIVKQQHVDVAEADLEPLRAASAEGVQELVRERLAGGAAHAQPRAVAEEQGGDGTEQVRLAHAGRPTDEQRVVGLSR